MAVGTAFSRWEEGTTRTVNSSPDSPDSSAPGSSRFSLSSVSSPSIDPDRLGLLRPELFERILGHLAGVVATRSVGVSRQRSRYFLCGGRRPWTNSRPRPRSPRAPTPVDSAAPHPPNTCWPGLSPARRRQPATPPSGTCTASGGVACPARTNRPAPEARRAESSQPLGGAGRRACTGRTRRPGHRPNVAGGQRPARPQLAKTHLIWHIHAAVL